MIGSVAIRRADLARVEVLEDDPATRGERRRRACRARRAGRGCAASTSRSWMRSHGPSGIGSVTTSTSLRLELRAAVVLEPPRVEVEREHTTRRADLPRHPPSDRASASTDLEAAATRPAGRRAARCAIERWSNVRSRPPNRSTVAGSAFVEQVLGLTHGTSPLSRTHRLGEPTLGQVTADRANVEDLGEVVATATASALLLPIGVVVTALDGTSAYVGGIWQQLTGLSGDACDGLGWRGDDAAAQQALDCWLEHPHPRPPFRSSTARRPPTDSSDGLADGSCRRATVGGRSSHTWDRSSA